MTALLRTVLAVLTILSFSGEVVEAAVPQHDHHFGHEDLASGGSGDSGHRHAQHPVHACGVCHHVIPAHTGAPAINIIAARPAYCLAHERGAGRALAPPLQPPIG